MITLGTSKIDKKYKQYLKKTLPNICILCERLSEDIIEKFKYWIIISNKFPYDKIASKSDILLTKRHIDSEGKLTDNESLELLKIKTSYLVKTSYSAIYENLPRQQSVKGHYHIHLITLKKLKKKR